MADFAPAATVFWILAPGIPSPSCCTSKITSPAAAAEKFPLNPTRYRPGSNTTLPESGSCLMFGQLQEYTRFAANSTLPLTSTVCVPAVTND